MRAGVGDELDLVALHQGLRGSSREEVRPRQFLMDDEKLGALAREIDRAQHVGDQRTGWKRGEAHHPGPRRRGRRRRRAAAGAASASGQGQNEGDLRRHERKNTGRDSEIAHRDPANHRRGGDTPLASRAVSPCAT